MIHENDILVLQKLLRCTKSGQVQWVEKRDEANEWYETKIGGCELCFRFAWYESTNQIGADRRAFELFMPGRNAVFFFGSEGADLMFEILAAAFKEWTDHVNPSIALDFLNEHLPE
ncbi:hypothetical protein M4951_04420 [Blastopirellula sp. J2-11]|uniref:hypothetical protein n=1 Tax=Blastopirellula sp. J2-11 TaxID=2943192 RepID=UPI0021CA55D2|nr:hypothetical protein [Blastopirellula sp. J2-11]UUO07548.1 hypothetical protein M4951_04375 [Blastopirellula sp. J2-11]UUO07556.1 hypothetical protein M4951_04420 [Blastopirellula sp. J2-11]